MAQLPPDGQWLVQQIDGQVQIFDRNTQEVLIRFDPTLPGDIAKAQGQISRLVDLTNEQKVFAHFWSGYFYAFANLS